MTPKAEDKSSSIGSGEKKTRRTLSQQTTMIKIEEKSSGQEWELTWPIWHLLPHMDRKRIAAEYRMNIGQFEEFVSLQQAVGISIEGDEENSGDRDGLASARASVHVSPNNQEQKKTTISSTVSLSDDDDGDDGPEDEDESIL